MILSRRRLITGMAALIAAPAIIRVAQLYVNRELLTSNVTFTGPDPIPLPPALVLFGSALAGIGLVRRLSCKTR